MWRGTPKGTVVMIEPSDPQGAKPINRLIFSEACAKPESLDLNEILKDLESLHPLPPDAQTQGPPFSIEEVREMLADIQIRAHELQELRDHHKAIDDEEVLPAIDTALEMLREQVQF